MESKAKVSGNTLLTNSKVIGIFKRFLCSKLSNRKYLRSDLEVLEVIEALEANAALAVLEVPSSPRSKWSRFRLSICVPGRVSLERCSTNTVHWRRMGDH